MFYVCHYFLDVNGRLHITGTTYFTDAISPGKNHEEWKRTLLCDWWRLGLSWSYESNCFAYRVFNYCSNQFVFVAPNTTSVYRPTKLSCVLFFGFKLSSPRTSLEVRNDTVDLSSSEWSRDVMSYNTTDTFFVLTEKLPIHYTIILSHMFVPFYFSLLGYTQWRSEFLQSKNKNVIFFKQKKIGVFSLRNFN